MRPPFGTGVLCAVLLACLAAVPLRALAQHGGGGHGLRGGMGGARRGFGHDYAPNTTPHPSGGTPTGNPPDSAGGPAARGGLQLGPPGRWWDDKRFADELKLRPDQQQRMDGIFEANRANLLKHHEAYQGAQARLGELTRASIPDEGALYAQIDRVSQARAQLEKANAHYLLQLRNEMDKDQVSRLGDHR